MGNLTVDSSKGISVIIPVYNSEKYLKACLDSVVSQTCREMEIILVNDGSTDASPEICQHYAKADDRIRYISQENAGEAAARNTGLKAAAGAYLLFVDSDDLLAPGICHRICREMQDYDLMLMHYQNFRGVSGIPGSGAVPEGHREDLCRYSLEDWAHSLLGPEKTVPDGLNLNPVWAKAYRRQFVQENGIVFPADVVIGPDMLFNLQVYLKAPRVCCLPVNACFYRYNQASVVHRYNPDFQRRDRIFQEKLEEILRQAGLADGFQEELGYQRVNGLLQIFSSDLFHPHNPKPEKERRSAFLELVSREEYRKQIPEQRKRFGVGKGCVLHFAMNKQYFPVRSMYLVKDVIKRIRRK